MANKTEWPQNSPIESGQHSLEAYLPLDPIVQHEGSQAVLGQPATDLKPLTIDNHDVVPAAQTDDNRVPVARALAGR